MTSLHTTAVYLKLTLLGLRATIPFTCISFLADGLCLALHCIPLDAVFCHAAWCLPVNTVACGLQCTLFHVSGQGHSTLSNPHVFSLHTQRPTPPCSLQHFLPVHVVMSLVVSSHPGRLHVQQLLLQVFLTQSNHHKSFFHVWLNADVSNG